jgi:TRAP-type transport system small permease protein
MFDKLLGGLRKVLYWFSVVAMMIMLVLVFAQVISRYIFNYTPEWSEELARYLFVWVTFLGSALILGESGHLSVELLPEKFKGTATGNLLSIIINLASYIFVLILFFQGLKMTQVMTFQTSPGMGITMSFIYCVIPLGASLMFLYLVKDTMNIIKSIFGVKEHSKRKAR